ncbi:MAG: hypothetical protein ACTSVZ_08665, partial [Promethearchaeota archaeon]
VKRCILYDIVCENMGTKKNKRISLTASEDELFRWEAANYEGNLSAFIRKAVNEYVKIQDPEKERSMFDVFLDQQTGIREIKESLIQIENDLFEITASMARKNILPESEEKIIDARILQFINDRLPGDREKLPPK